MANHSLRTVIAQTLEVVKTYGGYVPATKNSEVNTQTKVLEALKNCNHPIPALDQHYWDFADEIILYFKSLPTLPEYKSIMGRSDGTMYATCIDIAQQDEVSQITFPFATAMGNLYAKLAPAPPQQLDSKTSKAKIRSAGEYLGVLNEQDRFFLKLVGVKNYKNGLVKFELEDRSGNLGIFYEEPKKLIGTIKLGNCFAIHAVPFKQEEKDGEKETVFKAVQILKDTLLPGKPVTDKTKDETGKYS